MQDKQCGIVHVIDYDAGIRNSLLTLITSSQLSAAAYESAEEFLNNADSDPFGCIVLDLRTPGTSGIELLQRLRADGNHMPVVLISGHADVPTTVRGMKLGAVDVLQKPVEPAAMIETIQSALRFSEQLQNQQDRTQSIRKRFQNLTSRELELLRLVVDGLSNKQIASQLGISIKTVANHRAHLMAKTGALNAADLARLSTLAGVGADAAGPVRSEYPAYQLAM